MDALVTTDWSETVTVGYIGKVGCKDCSDKQDTSFVFIEGCDLEQSE